MNKKVIIAALIECANELDDNNIHIEADAITAVAQRLAQFEELAEPAKYGEDGETPIVKCKQCGAEVICADNVNECDNCQESYYDMWGNDITSNIWNDEMDLMSKDDTPNIQVTNTVPRKRKHGIPRPPLSEDPERKQNIMRMLQNM